MFKKIYRKSRLINQYVRSRAKCHEYTSDFKEIETFCVFLGYPRSGHTLIGSLLDAHPEMVFSNELNVFRHLKYKFTREQIFYLISENSRVFSKKGRLHTGYSYKVENQWQGHCKRMKVVGDKRGSGSVKKLFYRPALFEKMYKEIGLKIKFIHIMRNPFDNISTMCIKSRRKNINESMDLYFFLADEITKLKKHISSEDIIELSHESFISKPKESLTLLTNFLGVESDPSYLEDCTKILFKKPNKTRYNFQWSEKLITRVNDRIRKYPFLAHYSFDS